MLLRELGKRRRKRGGGGSWNANACVMRSGESGERRREGSEKSLTRWRKLRNRWRRIEIREKSQKLRYVSQQHLLLSNILWDGFGLFSFVQLLKKPERSEENESENPKEKAKKPEKLTKEDRLAGSGDHKRRQNIEYKEDRGRRSVTPF